MDGTGLRFLEDNHQRQAAARSNDAGRHTCGGYDRVKRLMTPKEMAGVPIIEPWAMLAPVGKLVQRHKRMSAAVVNKAYTCAREDSTASA